MDPMILSENETFRESNQEKGFLNFEGLNEFVIFDAPLQSSGSLGEGDILHSLITQSCSTSSSGQAGGSLSKGDMHSLTPQTCSTASSGDEVFYFVQLTNTVSNKIEINYAFKVKKYFNFTVLRNFK